MCCVLDWVKNHPLVLCLLCPAFALPWLMSGKKPKKTEVTKTKKKPTPAKIEPEVPEPSQQPASEVFKRPSTPYPFGFVSPTELKKKPRKASKSPPKISNSRKPLKTSKSRSPRKTRTPK